MKEQDKDLLLSQMKFPLHINKDGDLIDAEGTNADNKFTKEEAELFVEISLDAVNKIYTPKPHLSEMANSPEDCMHIANMLDCQYKRMDVAQGGFVIVMSYREVEAALCICYNGNISLDVDDLPAPAIQNGIQIVAFILSKYRID